MKILIAGSSGFIGKSLVERLLKNGFQVDALARNPDSLGEIKNPNFKIETGDVCDPASLYKLEGEWDACVNAAGLMGKFGVTRDQLRAVNVDGPQTLYRFCLERGVKHFIHLSTVGVAGPSDEKFRDEDFPCNPSNDYEISKRDGEKAVLDLHRPEACRVGVVRVGFTYGPGDLHKLSLFRAINGGKFFLIGKGDALLQPIYIDDLTDGFVKLIKRRPEGAAVFNMCGGEAVSWKEFTATLAGLIGKKLPAIHIPLSVAKGAATVFEGAGKIFGFNPILTHSRISLTTQSYTYNIDRAREAFGFNPETGFREGLEKTVNWYSSRRLI